MNILITGGTGFIGTEVRDYFLKKGHFLTIITRSPQKHENETAHNQTFISWDSDLVEAMEQTDVVINLVGESIFGKLWTDGVKKRLRSSRIDTTRLLVEAIEKTENRPKLFISTSGVNYYGDRGDEILDEEEPPGDKFLSQLCVDWEAAAEPVKGLGVRLVIFRNGIVLETGGGAFRYMLPIFKLGLGGPIGSGTQYLPWIHMLDYCRATEFAIDHDEISGPCNLNAPDPDTMNALVDTLGEVLHRPAFFKVPEFAVNLVLGEAAGPLLESVRTRPKRLQEAGFEFRFKHLEEALSDIV